MSLSRVSAKKLSDGGSVKPEQCGEIGRALACYHGSSGWSGGGAAPVHRHSLGSERAAELECRIGSRCVGSALRARFAAIERQCAQIAFKVGIERVVTGGLAPKRVEVGLIAIHVAGDAADASGLYQRGKLGYGGSLPAVMARHERGLPNVGSPPPRKYRLPSHLPSSPRCPVASTAVESVAVGPINSSAVVAV